MNFPQSRWIYKIIKNLHALTIKLIFFSLQSLKYYSIEVDNASNRQQIIDNRKCVTSSSCHLPLPLFLLLPLPLPLSDFTYASLFAFVSASSA